MGILQIFTLLGANDLRDEAIEEMDAHTKSYESTVYYMDIVSELEKMGDFMINMSQTIHKTYMNVTKI